MQVLWQWDSAPRHEYYFATMEKLQIAAAIVHFKRLCSRHIHKEIDISECVFRFNEIICETGLKPNSDTYTQLQHHQRRTLWSNMKSDYVSLWYTQFRKLRASKGSDLLLCNDTEFDLHLVILNTLHWQLPFHSTLVTRRPYLGHDNWRLRYRFFPIIKYHWHFDTHEKD